MGNLDKFKNDYQYNMECLSKLRSEIKRSSYSGIKISSIGALLKPHYVQSLPLPVGLGSLLPKGIKPTALKELRITELALLTGSKCGIDEISNKKFERNPFKITLKII